MSSYRIVNRFTGEILPTIYTSRKWAERGVASRRPKNPVAANPLTWRLNPYEIEESYEVAFTDGTTETQWHESSD